MKDWGKVGYVSEKDRVGRSDVGHKVDKSDAIKRSNLVPLSVKRFDIEIDFRFCFVNNRFGRLALDFLFCIRRKEIDI